MDRTPVQNTVDGEQLEPLKIKKAIQVDGNVVGNIENVLIPFTTNWYQIDLKQLQNPNGPAGTIQLRLNFPKDIVEPVLNLYAHNLSDDVQYGIGEPANTAFPADQLIRIGKKTLETLGTTNSYIEIKCGAEVVGKPTAEGVLLISNLSFIKGLNPVLNPILPVGSATLEDLETLRALCQQLAGEYTFYDTCPINNQVAIDFAGKDDINSYTTWLDKNNINNNFVVCQLDTESFDQIRLTRASKIS